MKKLVVTDALALTKENSGQLANGINMLGTVKQSALTDTAAKTIVEIADKIWAGDKLTDASSIQQALNGVGGAVLKSGSAATLKTSAKAAYDSFQKGKAALGKVVKADLTKVGDKKSYKLIGAEVLI